MSGQNTSSGFIVKVKLLTNEVFEIQAQPDMLISQFKRIVQEKTKVPAERQKIVFGGKALIDQRPLKEYIHQSGLTVHLIAKSAPPATNPTNPLPNPPAQNNNNNQPNTNNQQSNNQQPNNNMPNPFANLLGAFQNPSSDPNQFSMNIGNAVNSLFGNLGPLGNPMANGNMGNIGIRVVHGTVNGQPIVNNQMPIHNNQPNTQQLSNPQPNTSNQQNQVPFQQNQAPNNPPNSHSSASNNQNTSNNNQGAQNNNHNRNLINPNQPSRLFEPLQQLELSLNRANNPYSLGQNNSLQQSTINYFKRLQSEMLRTAAQLNRSIHMLQQGQFAQLHELVPVFQALSHANLTAIDLINRNQHENNRGNHESPLNNNQHIYRNNEPQNHFMPQVTATIIIQQEIEANTNPNIFQNLYNQHLGSQRNQPSQPTQPASQELPIQRQQSQPAPIQRQPSQQPNIQRQASQQPQQPNVMNVLGNALNTNSGFNFANLFPPQRPNMNNTFNMTSSNTQPPNTPNQQNRQLGPQNPLSALQGVNLIDIISGNPSNQQSQLNPLNQSNQPNQPNQPQNPLQGMNIMGMIGDLQQNGGIGGLLGMSIGSMLQEQGQDPTVYSAILNPISGSEVMACFTQKDFTFISRKRQQFRDSVLRAISIAGSRQDLTKKYSEDLLNLLIPNENISRIQTCKGKVRKIITKYVEQIIQNFLYASAESDLTGLIMTDLKRLYCESINEIAKYTANVEQVFGNMKKNVVAELDKVCPGLSGMFYSIVEKDLVRVYKDYEAEKKRKEEMSEQQAKDEADLMKKIQQASKQDVAYMSTYQHSKFYPAQKNQ